MEMDFKKPWPHKLDPRTARNKYSFGHLGPYDARAYLENFGQWATSSSTGPPANRRRDAGLERAGGQGGREIVSFLGQA